MTLMGANPCAFSGRSIADRITPLGSVAEPATAARTPGYGREFRECRPGSPLATPLYPSERRRDEATQLQVQAGGCPVQGHLPARTDLPVSPCRRERGGLVGGHGLLQGSTHPCPDRGERHGRTHPRRAPERGS